MRFVGRLRHQKLLSATLLLFTLSIGVLIGTLVNTAVRAEKAQSAAGDAAPLAIPSPSELATSFTALAKQLEPSVVNIKSTFAPREGQQRTERRQQPRRLPDEQEGEEEGQGGFDLFRRFFGGDPFDMPHPYPFRREGTGSGVIVDGNGYILTNYHVIEGASRVQVKFNDDSTEYNAKLIGSDPEMDLAVLKLENGKKLKPARIGNSEGVQVGDWAVAIGSPFGLEATVTAGIISATGRELGGTDHQLQRFLQTDAAINPGNSGGPLLNIKGEVIGINTAIATESGGYQGIGFALPINTAVNSYNQIIKNGRVARGSIGVGFDANQSPDLLKAWGAPNGQGVMVTRVTAGGPADKAGIRVEDIITSYNGQPVKDGEDLVNRVSGTMPDTTARVEVLRGGKKMDFEVRIGERTEVWADDPRFRRFRRPEPESEESSTQVKFGMDIQNLTQAARDRMGLKEKTGVLIERVLPNSFAEDIGLLPRDVIVSINRQPVSSIEDVQKIQAGLKPGDAVGFHVKRPLRAAGRPGTPATEWADVFNGGTLPAHP
jgi:serine protease Do